MAGDSGSILTPHAALAYLLEGNRRFADGRPQHPRADRIRRGELTKGQQPFAAVIGCSDSRVPPEIVFDQGMGDLFVVRTAGNVLDDIVMASVEYAVDHLRVKLVLVLGHTKCGAVTAACGTGAHAGHLPALLAALKPAVDAARIRGGDPVAQAVVENARRGAETLAQKSEIVRAAANAGTLRMAAAKYDLESGLVEIL
jgi:carbonic anhydrase